MGKGCGPGCKQLLFEKYKLGQFTTYRYTCIFVRSNYTFWEKIGSFHSAWKPIKMWEFLLYKYKGTYIMGFWSYGIYAFQYTMPHPLLPDAFVYNTITLLSRCENKPLPNLSHLATRSDLPKTFFGRRLMFPGVFQSPGTGLLLFGQHTLGPVIMPYCWVFRTGRHCMVQMSPASLALHPFFNVASLALHPFFNVASLALHPFFNVASLALHPFFNVTSLALHPFFQCGFKLFL